MKSIENNPKDERMLALIVEEKILKIAENTDEHLIKCLDRII